ncbi:unnamed protein product [Owenia fusiformis]|uniref:Ig-like domain-containing protein n=1 Tax=Owenia fusiformis TaxID=6347 RepID=A0A8S4P8L1_OWEFU|nr:unnamed protein product [Owenia fusiformis]
MHFGRELVPILLVFVTFTSAIYIETKKPSRFQIYKKHLKKRGRQLFKSDPDIDNYLSIYDTDVMIWRCRNAIQPPYDGSPIPVVELYCEVLGSVADLQWFHNGKKIHVERNPRYQLSAVSHYYRHYWFNQWINFTLKIFNATNKDSGIYTVKAISPKKKTQSKTVFMDISVKQWSLKHHRSHNMIEKIQRYKYYKRMRRRDSQ